MNKSTPSCMMYGETGQFPLEIQAKSRMLSFWFKLISVNYSSKFSSIMYKFLYDLYRKDQYKSTFLTAVHETLNNIGLSGIWTNQFNLPYTEKYFKAKITRTLKDQYIQEWFSNLNSKEVFYNYRLFKSQLSFENYFKVLPENLALTFARFRTLNHRLPIQRGRALGIPHNERICPKCNSDELGDEFHYVFNCPFFKEYRHRYLTKFYYKHPNVLKFHTLFNNANKSRLNKLIAFLKIIMSSF